MNANEYMEEVKGLEFKDAKTLIELKNGKVLEKENFTAEYPDDGLTIVNGDNSIKIMGSRWAYLPEMIDFKIMKVAEINVNDKWIIVYKPLVNEVNDIYVKVK